MQPNQPIPGKKHASGERPAVRYPRPRRYDADESASKSDFPGQADPRTYLDPDGNHERAGKAPPRKTGDSK